MKQLTKYLLFILLIIAIPVILLIAVDKAFYWFGWRQHLGIDPDNKPTRELYGRLIDPFVGFKNNPNFVYEAFDGLHNYDKGILTLDSNGFVTGDSIPLSLEKDSNTIRIFLLGGSAMFGNLQSRVVVNDDSYPDGVLTYSSSIAGRINTQLRLLFPNKKIQVINAAVSKYQFHQEYLIYMTKVHQFHPDLIVNFTGNNDGPDFLSKKFEECSEYDDYLEIEARMRERNFSYAISYLNYLKDKKNRGSANHYPNIIMRESRGINLADWDKLKPYVVAHTLEPGWVVESYEKQLLIDGVKSIFVLQPMLQVEVPQKKRSALENKILRELTKVPTSLGDSIEHLPQIAGAIALFGKEKFYEMRNITQAYQWAGYVSPTLDSIVTRNGGTYINMNEEIAKRDSCDEVFVDYCHLTSLGNEIVANRLTKEIVKVLQMKGMVN